MSIFTTIYSMQISTRGRRSASHAECASAVSGRQQSAGACRQINYSDPGRQADPPLPGRMWKQRTHPRPLYPYPPVDTEPLPNLSETPYQHGPHGIVYWIGRVIQSRGIYAV